MSQVTGHRSQVHTLLHDLWKVALAVFLVLIGLEAAQRGFVSRFFDLNHLVLFLFLVSVILLMTRPKRSEGDPSPPVALQAVGIVASAAVWVTLDPDVTAPLRALAAGGTLLLALLAGPIIRDR